MSKVRVPLHGRPGNNFVAIEAEATVGAVIGRNLFNLDGSLFDPATVVVPAAARAAEEREQAMPAAGYTDAMADVRVAAGLATHVDAEDPHTQYITAAELAAALAGISGGVLPLVTGAIVSGQPQFVYAGDGSLIYAEIT